MFCFRDRVMGGPASVEVAFTDASLNLQGLQPGFPDQLATLETALDVRFARMHQTHGAQVARVDRPSPAHHTADLPEVDALVTAEPDVGLMVRTADCVPVALADVAQGVLGVAHAGRNGVLHGVVPAAVHAMREVGADQIQAWIGPHVCGRCYEVPEDLQEQVAAVVPQTRCRTSRDTPGLDLTAGVLAQLDDLGVERRVVAGCTLEDTTLHSHRRDQSASGRLAGLIWMRAA